MPGDGGELSDAAPVLVVAGDAAATARLGRVVERMPRGRVTTAGWADAAAAIGEQARLGAVLADCSGLDEATLASTLPGLAQAAELNAVPLVVGFTHGQLDAVAGLLLGGNAQLLSDPDAIDWATALALAGVTGAAGVREGAYDAERYRRLSEEVARIADALAQLIEPQPAREQESGRGDGFVGEPPRDYGTRTSEPDPAEVRRAIRARRLRDEVFSQAGLFEDPAWDMLLDLFAAELERRPVSVSSLCIAAAVPATTALRWITKLISAALLERRPDDLDRRRAFISLSGKASLAMRNYVVVLKRAGLTLG